MPHLEVNKENRSMCGCLMSAWSHPFFFSLNTNVNKSSDLFSKYKSLHRASHKGLLSIIIERPECQRCQLRTCVHWSQLRTGTVPWRGRTARRYDRNSLCCSWCRTCQEDRAGHKLNPLKNSQQSSTWDTSLTTKAHQDQEPEHTHTLLTGGPPRRNVNVLLSAWSMFLLGI